MKKVFLLLTIGSIGLTATAQESRKSVVFSNNQSEETRNALKLSDARKNELLHRSAAKSGSANKTTAAPTSRWYNYGDYFDATIVDGGNTTDISSVIMWYDTLGRVNYTSGMANNNMVSVGSVLHPQIAGFNDPTYYSGKMMLTSAKAYTCDSIRIYGVHNFSAAKTGVVDTVIITTLHGGTDILSSGYVGMMANYGADTLRCKTIGHDSVTNHAMGATASTIKVPITAAMWGDTTASGIFVLNVPVSISCAADEKLACSITFKTGDASFPTTLPGGVIEMFDGTYTYNNFYTLANYKLVGTTVAFAPYITTPQIDYNEGLYKTLPSFENGYSGEYVPMWAWTSASGAYYGQHIYMDWKLNCATCDAVGFNEVIKNVTNTQVYPNPAATQVTVAFDMTNAASATVTLTNTVGQVVATQAANNNKATFNTAALPAGIYMYTITANGEQTTGRVAIAH